MDVTALLPTIDPLAAQLRRAAPARVQANRAAFKHLIEPARDRADRPQPGAGHPLDAPTRDRQPRPSDRLRDATDRQPAADRPVDDELSEHTLDAPRPERGNAGPRPDDTQSGTNRPPRAENASAEPLAAPAEGPERSGAPAADGAAAAAVAAPATAPVSDNAEVPARLVMAPAAVAVPPAPAPDGAAKPAVPAAQPGAAATQTAGPAGVALAGVAADSTVPALVAPLAKPSGAPSGIENAIAAIDANPAANPGTETAVNALVAALVGKTTVRGQRQAMGAVAAQPGEQPAAAPQGAAPATPQNAPQAAQPAVPPPGPAPQLAPSANPAVTSAGQPVAAAANEAPHPALLLFAQEGGSAPGIRITTVPYGGDQGFGKAAGHGAAGASPGIQSHAQGNAAPMTPVPQQLPEPNAARAAVSHAQPAAPPAQAALAAGGTSEPAPAMFDMGKGAFDPLAHVGRTAATTGAGASQGAARGEAARMSRPPVPYAPVAEQVAVRIGKAIAEGADRIDIRLKPAALGSVRIHMEVTHDGRVQAVVTADRADTLDMLKQDARSLERALHDAGLKADSNSLSFNLRGGDHRHSEAGNGEAGPRLARESEPPPDDADGAADAATAYLGHVGLLDIRV